MGWIRDLFNTRPQPEPSIQELPASLISESEDELEAFTEMCAAKPGFKETLSFGKARVPGGLALLGYCEVRNKDTVEACEWRAVDLKKDKRSPTHKIKF